MGDEIEVREFWVRMWPIPPTCSKCGRTVALQENIWRVGSKPYCNDCILIPDATSVERFYLMTKAEVEEKFPGFKLKRHE